MFNICIVNSNYSLLLYILLYGSDKTFYILGHGISKEIAKNIRFKIMLPNIRSKSVSSYIWLFFYYAISTFFIKPLFFIFNVKTIGHDHLYFSNLLSRNYTLIEDGLGNYITRGPKRSKYLKLFSLIDEQLGYSNKCRDVILTGLDEIPIEIKDKIVLINIETIWHELSSFNKKRILIIFNVKLNDYFKFKDYTIILTQPFKQDGFINEKTQNDIYNNIVIQYNIEKLIIKRHPRDNFSYDLIIDYEEIESSIPLELLSIGGVRFNMAFTYYSTSIKSINANKAYILGTMNLKKINNNFPDVEREIF